MKSIIPALPQRERHLAIPDRPYAGLAEIPTCLNSPNCSFGLIVLHVQHMLLYLRNQFRVDLMLPLNAGIRRNFTLPIYSFGQQSGTLPSPRRLGTDGWSGAGNAVVGWPSFMYP